MEAVQMACRCSELRKCDEDLQLLGSALTSARIARTDQDEIRRQLSAVAVAVEDSFVDPRSAPASIARMQDDACRSLNIAIEYIEVEIDRTELLRAAYAQEDKLIHMAN
jgi:hypothetical protein